MKLWMLLVFLLGMAWFAFGEEQPHTANEMTEQMQAFSSRLASMGGKIQTLETSFRDGGWRMLVGGAIGFLVGVAMMFVASLFSRKIRSPAFLRSLEFWALMGIVFLIMLGAYRLTSRIVDTGSASNASSIVDAPNRPSAVLNAYKVLSGELERWFSLFAVLGTFVGLVLPVGGYLLQMKAVREHEESVKKAISAAIADAKTKLETLEGKTAQVQANLPILWQQQGVYAKHVVSQCGKKVVDSWRQGTNDMGLVRNMCFWSTVLNECAFFTGSGESMIIAVRFWLQSFMNLREELEASGHWAAFKSALESLRQKQPLEIHMAQDVQRSEGFRDVIGFFDDMGIDIKFDMGSSR